MRVLSIILGMMCMGIVCPIGSKAAAKSESPIKKFSGDPYAIVAVVDGGGRIIPDAEILLRRKRSSSLNVKWHAMDEGKIKIFESELTNWEFKEGAGRYTVYVRAKGFAPRILELDLPFKEKEKIITLEKGKEVILHIASSQPIPNPLYITTVIDGGAVGLLSWVSFDNSLEGTTQKTEDLFNLTPFERTDGNTLLFRAAEWMTNVCFGIQHSGFSERFSICPI